MINLLLVSRNSTNYFYTSDTNISTLLLLLSKHLFLKELEEILDVLPLKDVSELNFTNFL